MSDHLKRLAAPRSWPLKRKVSVWTVKQSPGSHSIETSLPATVMLRDMIKVCDTAREAKKIISDREFIVDGRAVRSTKAPVGLMDVISLPKMDLYYRVLINDKGKIALAPISKDDAEWKLCRINDKTKIDGGKIQLNLHDGRNLILDKNQYKTGDVLKISVPDQKIIGSFELAKGAVVLIDKGQHSGKTAVIAECVKVENSSSNIVRFEDGTETVRRNVFVIGTGSPAIKLPEADL
jgi:small subunit ribosomal protein S4e